MDSRLNEFDLTLTQAAAILPGRPSEVTVRRWATQGYRGVKLASIYVGRSRFTSRQSIEEFVRQLNPSPPAIIHDHSRTTGTQQPEGA